METSSPYSRPLVFGEVLFDVYPDGEEVPGGAPFNVAWHLAGFGLEPLFVSRVGDDARGHRLLDLMGRWGVDASCVQLGTGQPTGVVQVMVDGDQAQYDILADQAYDNIEMSLLSRWLLSQEISLVYHGSLALRADPSRSTFLATRRFLEAPVFMDLNLRKPWWKAGPLEGWMDAARWIKLNDQELNLISCGDSLIGAAESLRVQTGTEYVIVTRGAEGSFVQSKEGTVHTGAAVPMADFVDPVGAGDAYSAVFLLGLSQAWPLETTLARANDFAAALCKYRGAIQEDRHLYERFLNAWSKEDE